jgi:hypothetical protein
MGEYEAIIKLNIKEKNGKKAIEVCEEIADNITESRLPNVQAKFCQIEVKDNDISEYLTEQQKLM